MMPCHLTLKTRYRGKQAANGTGLLLKLTLMRRRQVLTKSTLPQQPIMINNKHEYVRRGHQNMIEVKSAFAKLQPLQRFSVCSRKTQNLPDQCSSMAHSAGAWHSKILTDLSVSTTPDQGSCCKGIGLRPSPCTTRLHRTTKQEIIYIILKRRKWKWFRHVFIMTCDLPLKSVLT